MYSITDLKKDTVIQMDGKPYRVIDYAQKQMGRGGSIVNVKLKNLLDGSVIPKTFKGQDKIEPAEVSMQKVQYLYADADNTFFMNNETFEQFELHKSVIGDNMKFLKEGSEANLQMFEERVINIELPMKVAFKVTESPDVVKGDTQSTVMKTVTLENGTEVPTPMFIKQGDTIIVDTRDGSYVERQKD